MIEADRVHSTPPLNTSVDQTRRGLMVGVASVLSASTVLAGAAVAERGVAVLPAVAGIPVSAGAGTDAELIALGKKYEILVDAYYAARARWAPAMVAAHAERDAVYGSGPVCVLDLAPEERAERSAALLSACERNGECDASDRMEEIAEEMEPLESAILALPVMSIEGLRAKALVAFKDIRPIGASDTEYCFDEELAFQRLFSAVAQVCGLESKVAAAGFDLPYTDCSDIDQDDEGEEV